MRKLWLFYIVLLGVFFLIGQSVTAENIQFNNDIYKLQVSQRVEDKKLVENEYYKDDESKEYWMSMFGVYHYLDISNPLKYAAQIDSKIEANDKCVLLKFVQNKKQDVAVISYLENGSQNDKNFFVYNVYKYAKHPDKGILVLRFSQKYVFNTNNEIVEIAKEVQKINDMYLEKMILTPFPPIVESLGQ